MNIRGALFAIVTLFAAPAMAKTPYVDLTPQFEAFFDETAKMDEAARVALFRERMNALLPGFYEPRYGATEERYNARIVRALSRFAALRPDYDRTRREFATAYALGIKHFRKEFPGFKPNVPIYLLHSLGEMDGGTRELRGKHYLVFGADVIAREHKAETIGPFLDHELFHVENGKYFKECDSVWCGLWVEGLATYAAAKMNPTADDAQLLLATPGPIRAPTDAKWGEALCYTRAKFDSAVAEDYQAFFMGGHDGPKTFPDRFGYYVGMKLIAGLGGKYSLAQLAHMPPETAKKALIESLAQASSSAGGCKPN